MPCEPRHCTAMTNWPDTIRCFCSDDILSVCMKSSCTVGVAPWFFNGVWNAQTTRECYEILDGVKGACFAVLQERFPQLIYGFKYPSSEYWRPNLATVLLLVALAPVLFRRLPKGLLVFTVIYPFLAYWLIWGGIYTHTNRCFRRLFYWGGLLQEVFFWSFCDCDNTKSNFSLSLLVFGWLSYIVE